MNNPQLKVSYGILVAVWSNLFVNSITYSKMLKDDFKNSKNK